MIMPKYNFQCDKCNYVVSEVMSISAYRKKKNETIKCQHCDDGVLFQVLNPVRSKVERSKEEMVIEIEEETRKIVNKVLSGDEKAIADVYGTEENTKKSLNPTGFNTKKGSFKRKEG